LMQTQFFWIPDSKTYQSTKFQQTKSSYKRDKIFLRWHMNSTSNRFCEETSPNYVPKHLNRHPSFYFANLAPLSQKSKFEDFMQDYFFFLRKIVLELLKCKLST
jgi:hypothetical protein